MSAEHSRVECRLRLKLVYDDRRMKMMRRFLVCIFISSATLSAMPCEAVTIFTSRNTWQTAAGGGTGDVFEDFNGITVPNALPADVGPFTISETGDLSSSISFNPASFMDVNGSNYVEATIDTGGGITSALSIRGLMENSGWTVMFGHVPFLNASMPNSLKFDKHSLQGERSVDFPVTAQLALQLVQ